jgi:hypothetical protein
MGLNSKQQDKIMHIIFAMLCSFICSALIAHTTTTPLISGLFIFYILNSLFEGVMIYRILLVAITLIPFLDHYVVQKQANWLQDE